MGISVNWNQGKVASDGYIRAHQVIPNQPPGCRFVDMKGDWTDFPSVTTAEQAIKQAGYSSYKHCEHCWDKVVVDPIP